MKYSNIINQNFEKERREREKRKTKQYNNNNNNNIMTKKEKRKRKKSYISNITSREIKWKKGRLTRLGCGGIESFLQVCEVFFNSSSLEFVNFCFLQTLVDDAILPIGGILQCHRRIQCLQPVLELFHWGRQNAGRKNHLKRKKGKKKFQKEKENENEKGICQTRKLKENKMK